jgi:hypothetical protein
MPSNDSQIEIDTAALHRADTRIRRASDRCVACGASHPARGAMSDVERWHLLRFTGGEPRSICVRLKVNGKLQPVPARWEALEVVEHRHLRRAEERVAELEADLERERLARRVVDRALHALTRHEGTA